MYKNFFISARANMNRCLIIYLILLGAPIHAGTSAKFKLKDGRTKVAEFLRMQNDTIYMNIPTSDGETIQKKMHKANFTQVEFEDWEILDLGVSDYERNGSVKADTVVPVGTQEVNPDSNQQDSTLIVDDTFAFTAEGVLDTVPPAQTLPDDSLGAVDSLTDNSIISNIDSTATSAPQASADTATEPFMSAPLPPDSGGVIAADSSSTTIPVVDEVASLEKGEYVRKSVSYVPCAITTTANIDKFGGLSSRDMQSLAEEYFRRDILGDRFDLNLVPHEDASRVSAAVTSVSRGTEIKLVEIADKYLKSSIKNYVDKYKIERAKLLTTEQQENSFVTDKAKATAVTMEEIEKVFKTVFVAVPVITEYGITDKHTSITQKIDKNGNPVSVTVVNYTFKLECMIYWINIDLAGSSGSRVVKVVKAKKRVTGENISEIVYKGFGKVFHALEVGTKKIKYFGLTAQVTASNFFGADFRFKKAVDAQINNKYYFIEDEEREDGTIRTRKKGYGYIYRTDTTGLDYRLYRVAGLKVYPGMTVMEKSMFGQSVSAYGYLTKPSLYDHSTAWRHFPDDAPEEAIDYGVLINDIGQYTMLGVEYSLEAPYIRIPQFFLHANLEGGIAPASGVVAHGINVIFVDNNDNPPDTFLVVHKEDVSNTLTLSLKAGLLKRFYLRRLCIDVGVDGGVNFNSLFTEQREKTIEDTVLAELELFDSTGAYTPLQGLIYSIDPVFLLNLGAGVSITPNILLSLALNIPIYTDFTGWNYYDSKKESETYENSDGSTTTLTNVSDEKKFDIPGNGFKFNQVRLALKFTVEY